jgi:hypothetical protein
MNIVEFFCDVISTISTFSILPKKAIGPDASEKAFRSSGGVREGILGHPGRGPGGVLGGPGGVREVRGASWEGLGRSWGDLGATFSAVRFRIHFLSIWGAKKVPKGMHFGRPKGAKIDPKTTPERRQIEDDLEQRQKHSSRPSWSLLGPMIRNVDGAWSHLGAIWS